MLLEKTLPQVIEYTILMKHISSRLALYSLIYILIILLIFFLQFKKGTRFSYENSHLKVSGRFFNNEKKQKELLLPLHITSNGLLIFITAEEPLKALFQDGSIKELTGITYNIQDGAFNLLFEENVALRFAINNRAIANREEDVASLHISCTLPENIKEIYLPYKLAHRAKVERRGGQILIQYKMKSYAFSKMKDSLKQEGLTMEKNNFPTLCFSQNNTSIYYHEHIAKEDFNLENMLESPFASKKLYEKNLTIFNDIALSALEKEVKERRHSEKTIQALFAEEGRRSLYAEALTNYPSSLLPKGKRTFATSHFYGNLIENYKNKMLEDEGEISMIRSKLNSRDEGIFKIEHIYSFLRNRGEDALLSSMMEFLKTLDEQNLSTYELSNVLLICSEYSNDFPNQANELESIKKKCEALILSSLFAIDEKLYIQTKEGELDSDATFRIATSLIKYGRTEHKELLCTVGYFLFNSLYSFAEEASSFPSSFKITQDENKKMYLMARDKDILTIEELYLLFYPENTYLTHEIQFARNGQHGNIFALTIAKDIEIKASNAGSLSFTFTFDLGTSHYVVLQGIEPFSNIEIEGILGYKTDPRFEFYNASGYVYDEKTKTLYLKVKQNSEKEVVKLFY